MQRGRIDVHHHIIPPAYTQALGRHGIKEFANASFPSWSVKRSLAVMEVCGIQTAITSISCPGVFFGNAHEAKDLARSFNEFAANLGEQHPGRFGSFAVLPMPLTELACQEAVYALDTLKADGITLLASTEGKFLGDPKFDELIAELDRRQATVFVHPNLHETSKNLALAMPGFLMKFLCDTTRAALNLVLSGTMEKYPRIRWILAHAGGVPALHCLARFTGQLYAGIFGKGSSRGHALYPEVLLRYGIIAISVCDGGLA